MMLPLKFKKVSSFLKDNGNEENGKNFFKCEKLLRSFKNERGILEIDKGRIAIAGILDSNKSGKRETACYEKTGEPDELTVSENSENKE